MLGPAYFTDRSTLQGNPADDEYRHRNFDLCRAVDMTKLSIVLEEMVNAGMPAEQAQCFRTGADALLQLMRTENNRLRTTPTKDPTHDR